MSGKDNKDEQFQNIPEISLTLCLFDIELSDNENNDDDECSVLFPL